MILGCEKPIFDGHGNESLDEKYKCETCKTCPTTMFHKETIQMCTVPDEFRF